MTREKGKKQGKKPSLYWQLFTSTFALSAFTFGGGYVIIPLMKKKFCDEPCFLGEEEALDLVAIAQASPGALAVNTAMLLGYRMAGLPGAFVTILGTLLPPMITLSVISLFYDAFRTNRIVGALLHAMRAGVAAVIADVVWTMAQNILGQKRALPALIMLGTFAAVYFFRISVVLILPIAGILGALGAKWRLKQEEQA